MRAKSNTVCHCAHRVRKSSGRKSLSQRLSTFVCQHASRTCTVRIRLTNPADDDLRLRKYLSAGCQADGTATRRGATLSLVALRRLGVWVPSRFIIDGRTDWRRGYSAADSEFRSRSRSSPAPTGSRSTTSSIRPARRAGCPRLHSPPPHCTAAPTGRP